MPGLERLSPCKINLLLNILGRRPDGFHELETLFLPVPLHDRLNLEISPSPGLHFTCNHPGLPTGPENLVVRAAQAFFDDAALAPAIRIHLEKNLPLSAGLGAGSANAATTLTALNDLFDHPLSLPRLAELAASLGSDVPFFLQSQPALAFGRGENLEPLPALPALHGAWLLLVHPGFGVSTAWAYRALADFPGALHGQPGRASALAGAMQTGSLSTAAAMFYNSLEAPVLRKYPLLELWQEFFREEGALGTLMSGSGSTTFALWPNRPAAEQARERLRERFSPSYWTALVELAPV